MILLWIYLYMILQKILMVVRGEKKQRNNNFAALLRKQLNTLKAAKIEHAAWEQGTGTYAAVLRRILSNARQFPKLNDALQSDDGPLLKFLKSSGGLVDLQYALRVSTQHRQTKACIFVYSKMGLYEEAVKMALGEDINLAKENANLPPDREVQKRLWLMIARFIIEDANSDIKDSIHVRAQHARRESFAVLCLSPRTRLSVLRFFLGA